MGERLDEQQSASALLVRFAGRPGDGRSAGGGEASGVGDADADAAGTDVDVDVDAAAGQTAARVLDRVGEKLRDK